MLVRAVLVERYPGDDRLARPVRASYRQLPTSTAQHQTAGTSTSSSQSEAEPDVNNKLVLHHHPAIASLTRDLSLLPPLSTTGDILTDSSVEWLDWQISKDRWVDINMIWLNTGLFILIPLLSDIILVITLEVSLFKLSDDADKLNIIVSQSLSSFLFQSTNNYPRVESGVRMPVKVVQSEVSPPLPVNSKQVSSSQVRLS